MARLGEYLIYMNINKYRDTAYFEIEIEQKNICKLEL